MPKNKKKKKNKHRSNNSGGGGNNNNNNNNNTSRSSLLQLFSSKDKKPVTYLLLFLFLFLLFGSFFIFLDPIRSKLGFGSSSSHDIDPAKLRHYRARLKSLYQKYNESKLDEIDDILLKWRGKEDILLKQVRKKYATPKNKEKRQREKENKNKNRKRYDSDGNYIPDYNNETPEEASARRRKEKEANREKRKKDREGYYDDWSNDGSNNDDATTLRYDVCVRVNVIVLLLLLLCCCIVLYCIVCFLVLAHFDSFRLTNFVFFCFFFCDFIIIH